MRKRNICLMGFLFLFTLFSPVRAELNGTTGNSFLNVTYDVVTKPIAGVSYTPECLSDCDLPVNLTFYGSLLPQSVNITDFDQSFRVKNDDISFDKLDVLVNYTWNESIPIFGEVTVNKTYNETCSEYNATYYNCSDELMECLNLYTYSDTNDTCEYNTNDVTGYNNETNWEWKWIKLSDIGEITVDNGDWYVLNWNSNRSVKIGEYSADIVPEFYGYSFDNLAWMNTSWDFRKAITFDENSGNNLTNYPVVYWVNHGGNANTNCSDIRVTDENDNEIPFGMRNCNSTHVELTNKFNVTSSSSVDYYIYYGNPNAVTFENDTWNDVRYNLWDNFDGSDGTLPDTNKWTTDSSNSNLYCKIYNNVLECHTIDINCGSGTNRKTAQAYSNENFTVNGVGLWIDAWASMNVGCGGGVSNNDGNGQFGFADRPHNLTDGARDPPSGADQNMSSMIWSMSPYFTNMGVNHNTTSGGRNQILFDSDYEPCKWGNVKMWQNSTHFTTIVNGTSSGTTTFNTTYNDTDIFPYAYSKKDFKIIFWNGHDCQGDAWYDNVTVKYELLDDQPTLTEGSEEQKTLTWQNQNQLKSELPETQTNYLWSEFQDYDGLDYAILSVNTTGSWVNVSTSDMSDNTSWTYANFSYTVPSISSDTVIGWKIYANDTLGNENVTDVVTFTATNCPAYCDVCVDECQDLTQSSKYYCLADDLYTQGLSKCFELDGTDNTFDCLGHNLDSKYNQVGATDKAIILDNDRNTVINCNITDFGYGISTNQYDTDNMINDTYIDHCGNGIRVNSNNNWLDNVTVTDSTYGLVGYTSTHVKDSFFKDNTYSIRIDHDNFEMYGTIIQDSVNYGLYRYDSPSNMFLYNNLFNNTVNVYGAGSGNFNTTKQSGTRIYSDGIYIGGNYWTNSTGNGYSDTCTDWNKDGFCDNSYNFQGDDYDYLPLSDEYVTPSISVTFNFSSVSFGNMNQGTANNTAENQASGVYNVSVNSTVPYEIYGNATNFTDGTYDFDVSNLRIGVNETVGNLTVSDSNETSNSQSLLEVLSDLITENFYGFWLSIPTYQYASSYSSDLTLTYQNV